LSSTENFSITVMLKLNVDRTYSLWQNIFTLNPTTAFPINYRGSHWISGTNYKFIINPWIHN